MRATRFPAAIFRGLTSQPPVLVVVESVALTVVLGLLDVLTGAELSFSIFYLVPITLVAWTMSLQWALAHAFLAAVTWLVADRAAGQVYSAPLLQYWNASIRLGYFVLFAVLFSKLRHSLDNERQLSRRDPLTGRYNRRAFDELADREVRRAVRYRRPLSLCFIDIDHFKQINDRLGHETGDDLLREVGATMVTSLRSTDIVARVGGDEFAVVMPETTEEHALIALHKTRTALTDRMVAHAWPVTFSMGVVSTEGETDSLSELLALADARMYEAKAAGRDQIVGSRAQPMPEPPTA